MLYIIGNCKNELFKLFIDAIDIPVSVIPFEEEVGNIRLKRIAQILWRFKIFLKWKLFPSFYYEKIKSIPAGSEVIFFTIYPLPVMNTMAFMPKHLNCKIWFWDSFSTINCPAHKIVGLLRKLKLPIYTYDSTDAKNFDLIFIPQFFLKSYLEKNEVVNTDTDFYFLGTVKNDSRLEILDQVMKEIDKCSMVKDIRVVRDAKDYITYAENLEKVRKSRCLIEINSIGQYGLTLRAMEALFMRKKLLTNNPEIKKYDFYCKENIYVWGEETRSIEEFMNTECKLISDNIILGYDINQWLDKIS